MKICRKCKENKEDSEFTLRNKATGNTRTECKICEGKRIAQWRKENPDKNSKIYKRFYEKNCGKICLQCGTKYKPSGDNEYCSLKCKLLGNIIKKRSGCWIWKRSKTEFGYGKVCMNALTVSTHRAAYITFKGEIPDKMMVLHTCDVPSCINPDHLYLGDHLQNMKDCMERGRHYGLKRKNLKLGII